MRTRFVIALCSLAFFAPSAAGQVVVPPRDVVVLALGSDDDGISRLLRTARQLFGGGEGIETLRDVQMEIVRKTAPFGPVILLAPDDTTRSDVTARCDMYDVCDLLASGTVRIAVVPHDTAWIRDYGPVVELGPAGDLFVTDAIYHDVRRDLNLTLALKAVTEERLQLYKKAEEAADGGLLAVEDTGTSQEIQDKLALLRDRADMLQDATRYADRPQDDAAAFEIAQAVLLNTGRSVSEQFRATKIFLDGGNLLKTDEGSCFTTTALFGRNQGSESSLSEELKRSYGCRQTMYLESLPGDVIKHVDMFLLPVRGKAVLLANFGLYQPHIKSAWKNMTALERDLTYEAAIAMNKNAEKLRSHGFDVTLVPALVPRTSNEDDIYYPTVMNALARSNGKDRLQIIVPSYAGFQEDVQKAAHTIIGDAFGGGTELVTVESTVAARGQGAVHCLTITVPFAVSMLADGREADYRQMWAFRDSLNESLVHITRPTLLGRWQSVANGSRRGLTDVVPWEFVFDESQVAVRVGKSESIASYVVTKDHRFKWPLELTFDGGQRKSRGRIEWLTDRTMRLVLESSEPITLLKELVLDDVETENRVLNVGGEVNAVLGDEDPRDHEGRRVKAWALEGRAGETVTVDVATDEFDAEVLIAGPGLAAPLHNDDASEDTRNARVSFTFPATGPYKVIVRSFRENMAGAFTVRVASGDRRTQTTLAGVPVEGRTLVPGATATGELQSSMTLEGVGPVQAWGLSACQGRTIRIDLESDEFDPYLVVLGPEFNEPLANDDSEGTLNSRLEFECNDATTYKIVVATAVDSQTGRFRLSARVLDQ
jgi:agmatine/peptidylarginine deiminase